MKVDVLIEKGLDGTFDVHFDPDKEYNLGFGLLGQGNTIDEAIEDFYLSLSEMKELYKERNKEFPENIEFGFKYDVPSFLAHYKSIITLTGLGKLTGINPKQLNHYVTGVRKPSAKTVEKIEKSLQTFGKELSQLEFA
ncbi:MAG TPA: type II toxin-antitoxin system HicB family antitoxin [Salinivirgaceae bacterium]|jgi:predicted RNase H-like HicB family nuclease|nr:type II toxin-antitoxin system HicB family antitoxin [Bacteroidales bacterium]HPW66954.1 type II toxin-antitoxin system HicB family antitoxin [Salinivirgaceae bacterium]